MILGDYITPSEYPFSTNQQPYTVGIHKVATRAISFKRGMCQDQVLLPVIGFSTVPNAVIGDLQARNKREGQWPISRDVLVHP